MWKGWMKKVRNKRLIMPLLLVLLFSIFFCGCGEKKEIAQPSPSEKEADQPADSPARAQKNGVNVLTGLPIAESAVKNRPVAVMLNNLKAAQPQFGVSKADIIYEIPAEGGITRMLAVFQSVDGVGNIGSVRSTRSYYLDLVQGLDAILLHAGASPSAYKDIKSRGVTALDCVKGPYEGSLYWRDKNRIKKAGYEHSVFTSGKRLEKLFSAAVFRKAHQDGYQYVMRFAGNGTPASGTPASTIRVKFSNYKTGVFTYEARTGKYNVSQYGAPYVDGGTGKQVSVSNVLILRTKVSILPGDTAGRLQVDLIGSGKGSFACGGKIVDILWHKPSYAGQLSYTLMDGTPLILERGSSYVNIVGFAAPVTVEEASHAS